MQIPWLRENPWSQLVPNENLADGSFWRGLLSGADNINQQLGIPVWDQSFLKGKT